MRIALVTSLLWGGGAARVLVNMANYWSRAGHSVSLLSFEDGSQPSFYPVDARVRVVFLDIFGISKSPWERIRNNISRFVRIRRALLAEKPDVVISFIDSVNVRVILSMFGTGVPVVVSERIHPAHEPIGGIWEALRRMSYPFADALVVQTDAVKNFFSKWKLRDVRIIPNHIVPLPILATAPVLKRPSVVAVGRMAPQKNYPMLLRAVARALRDNPDWNLYIVGRRQPDTEVEALLCESSMRGRVHFIGQISDVGGVLAQTDIYVLSSLYEGFPNALCEAMASGLACIATDCPSGPADIIAHGTDGILVPNGDGGALADALCDLMSNGPKRENLGRAAANITIRLNEAAVMRLWEVCLMDVCRRKGVKVA